MQFNDEIAGSCRQLTLTDVDQALYALQVNPVLVEKHSNSSFSSELSAMLDKQEECDCCRLRRSNDSSRSFLPLARRGRPYFSSRSRRSLCTNCTEMKRQQQLDILPALSQLHSNQIFQLTINMNLSSDEQNALNDNQYQSSHVLVWNINSSDGNSSVDLTCDTDSLSESEKKALIEETVRKLRLILTNRSTTNTDQIGFTYRTLQTALNILSSSSHSSTSNLL
ncbi:unnamed protein product [Adineta ricciae]|uniref:Uncharacterized protein n=1 Tax=Adineta ricciae TaxID=249248 RepID=A0A815RSS7_ADIRI|nr:unnamed protein product [Adineta ricciae]CAF1481337.1 unnamed protein product [Adineta ricciae]